MKRRKPRLMRVPLDSMSSSNVGTVQKQLKRTSGISRLVFPKARVSIIGTLKETRGKKRKRKRAARPLKRIRFVPKEVVEREGFSALLRPGHSKTYRLKKGRWN